MCVARSQLSIHRPNFCCFVMPLVSIVSGVADLPAGASTLFNGGFAGLTVWARQNALQQTQTGSAIRNLSSIDLHTTLMYSRSALKLATLSHLSVSRPTTGASAGQGRTPVRPQSGEPLTGRSRAPVTLDKTERTNASPLPIDGRDQCLNDHATAPSPGQPTRTRSAAQQTIDAKHNVGRDGQCLALTDSQISSVSVTGRLASPTPRGKAGWEGAARNSPSTTVPVSLAKAPAQGWFTDQAPPGWTLYSGCH
jgi:hypothetical protein